MNVRIVTNSSILFLISVFIFTTSISFSQNCYHGELSLRYCDTNNDLVADTPSNQEEWLDLDTIFFSYIPSDNPKSYIDVWADFLDHMAAVTGKKVDFLPVTSNAEQLEAMRAGRLHVSGFNAGIVPFAVNTAGFHPFAMAVREDGSYGNSITIITPKNSSLTSPNQIKNHTMVYINETSDLGYKAPIALLKAEYNLTPNVDYEIIFSDNYSNSVLGITHEKYDVASIASSVLKQMIINGDIRSDDITIIYESQPFPTTAFGYVYNINPELINKIQKAFFSYDWSNTLLQEEFTKTGENKFIAINYKTYWEIIRKIDEINKTIY